MLISVVSALLMTLDAVVGFQTASPGVVAWVRRHRGTLLVLGHLMNVTCACFIVWDRILLI
jgi:hypothetical protein